MQKSVFTWGSQLPQLTYGLSVRHPTGLTYLPLLTRSHMKSFRYAEGCLVRRPRFTGGASGLLVTGCSLISSNGAPPPVRFCTSGPVSGSGSHGVKSGAGGGGRTSAGGSGRSSLARPSFRGMTTSYSGLCRASLSASGVPTRGRGLLPPHQG